MDFIRASMLKNTARFDKELPLLRDRSYVPVVEQFPLGDLARGAGAAGLGGGPKEPLRAALQGLAALEGPYDLHYKIITCMECT